MEETKRQLKQVVTIENKLLAKRRATATKNPCWGFLRFLLCANGGGVEAVA